MASIYRRGKKWWVCYRVNGKNVCRSLGTENERVARKKLKRIEGLKGAGELAVPSKIPLPEVLEAFCESLRATRTEKSAKNERSNLRGIFGPCCPALELGSRVPLKYRREGQELPLLSGSVNGSHLMVNSLEDISVEMLDRFIRRRLLVDKIAPKTANRLREVLHLLFNFAITNFNYVCPDRRFRNPAQGIKRVPEPAPEITWLTIEQITKQLEVLADHPRLRAMAATFIYAGLRREELLWLTHGDVDLSARLIRVHSKTIDGEFWQPKTRRNRVVPISAALLAELEHYHVSSRTTWFFPSPQRKRWDPDNFSQDLRKTNTQHGLTWTCLDFRHTFGSHLAQKGISLFKIAELMGNSPEICRRHYAALVPAEMHDEVEFR